jgi:spore maturation protein CgeB
MTDPALSILYVGPLNSGTTSRQRFHALALLGHRVTGVDLVPGDLAERQRALGWRVRRRLFGDPDDSRLNERLLARPVSPAPDVVWVDKGLTVQPATLRALRARWPSAFFVNYSGDDMFNPRNSTPAWRASLGLYDLFATTNRRNPPELKAAGAREVLCVDKGYSPEIHRPHDVTPGTRERLGGDVGFIGWPEGPRERSLRHLARHGVPVRVWGPWPRWKGAPNLRVEGRPVWDDEFARAVSSFRINLCFLRHANRDRQTSRSVMIPACGGFLLAERTDEHREMFREDAEAAFFSSDGELLEKVRWYLAHEDERRRVAEAGRRRCLESGYDHDSRLAFVLRHAAALRAAAA